MRALKAAWAEIAAKPARLAATVVAVLIGTGFACAALVFTSTFQADLAARLSAQYAQADLVVGSSDDQTAATARTLAALPGVADAEPLYSSYLAYSASDAHGYLNMQLAPEDPRLRWAPLQEGRWPQGTSEIAVTASTSVATGLPVGAAVTIAAMSVDGAAPISRTMTVVGVVDVSPSPLAGDRLLAFAPAAAFAPLGIGYAAQIAVLAQPDVTLSSLRADVADAVPQASVRTAGEQAAIDVDDYTGQTTALTTVLLGFAAIALLVAGLVIGNTFAILLAQRRRQIALLRCVGASRGQVRAQLLAEAFIVGAAGAVLGAAMGIAVGAVAASLTGLGSGGLAVPGIPIGAAALIGIAVTLLAATAPLARALRVAPLTALRPADIAEPDAARRSGRLRVALGALLLGGGGVLLAYGVIAKSVLVAMPGGATSAVGVLLLTRSFLPPLLRVAGRLGRGTGPVGRLAAANAVRNPRRAAATSTALVVGVALIVMFQVAAASVGASIDRATADRYPVDVVVAGDGTPLSGSLVGSMRDTPGIAGALAVHGTSARVSVASGDGPESGDSGGDPVVVVAAPDGANGVIRGGLAALDSGAPNEPTALVPTWWVEAGAVQLGDLVTLTVDGRSQSFTAAVGRLTEAGVTRSSTVVVTQAALDRLAPSARAVAVWGALTADADAPQVMAAINRLIARQPTLEVTGAAADRASLQSVLGTVTAVATGLLAVAVVIAIVGIGNTLGLAVAERSRESALLRALGLRRGQLRLMLAMEATLLAAVGAVVGLVLGLVYGWAGAAATFGEIGRTLVLSVPWGRVGVVLVLAVGAGALASVLPARRASRIAPAVALAEQ
jgi:putative ABC transport system permease protein